MLLTAGVLTHEWSTAYGLARQAGTVYRETSMVLHGNRAFGDTPEQLVAEWEQIIVDMTVAAGGSVETSTRAPTAGMRARGSPR